MTVENQELSRPQFHMPVNLKIDSYPSPAQTPDTEMSAGAAVLITFGVFAVVGLSIWTWWREKQTRERMRSLYARQDALHKQVQELTKPLADPPSRSGRVHTI